VGHDPPGGRFPCCPGPGRALLPLTFVPVHAQALAPTRLRQLRQRPVLGVELGGVDCVERHQGCLQWQGVAELLHQRATIPVDDRAPQAVPRWPAHARRLQSHHRVLGPIHQPAPVLVTLQMRMITLWTTCLMPNCDVN
jgi:hypothetical protein